MNRADDAVFGRQRGEDGTYDSLVEGLNSETVLCGIRARLPDGIQFAKLNSVNWCVMLMHCCHYIKGESPYEQSML